MTDIATDVQPDLAAAAAATAPAPEAAASESGQGNEGTGLYSLDSVPESIREQVAPIFKEWDANVTREFQKRAEDLNGWKAYEDLGVRDIDPEDMQHLVSFYELASDEEAFKNWVADAAKTLGIVGGEAPVEAGREAEVAAAAQAEGQAAGMSPEKVQEMIAEAITADREAREQEQQQQATIDEVARTVRETLDGFKLGDTPEAKQEAEELVCFMAQRHQDGQRSVEEALQAGYADYQRMVNGKVSDALDGKVNQPAATAVTDGRANSAPTPATSFAEAGQRTLERLRAASA